MSRKMLFVILLSSSALFGRSMLDERSLPAFADDAKKEPAKAVREECIIVDVEKKYELQSKNGMPIHSFTCSDTDALGASSHPTDLSQIKVEGKKEGTYMLGITTTNQEKETLTVVVVKNRKAGKAK